LCDTHYVSPNGANQHPYVTPETAATSIQAAVDAAEYGDTVLVGRGQYMEQVRLANGITLRGSGPELTAVEKPYGGDYAIRGAEDARTEDLSVTFRGPRDPLGCYSLGVWFVSAPNQVIDNCAVSGPLHAGVSCWGPTFGAPAVIMRSSVLGAGTGVDAAGVSCDVVIDRCTIEDNGIAVHTGGNTLISRCALLRNRAAIYPSSGLVRVESTRIDGNETGLSCQVDATVRMSSCLISRSSEAFVLHRARAVELGNCTISGNGLVFYIDEATVDMTNCIVWDNQALWDPVFPPYWGVTATYSDIQGGYQGLCNIDACPRFVDPPNRNYRLHPASPCIDAGTSTGHCPRPVRDVEGKRMPAYGGRHPDQPDLVYYDMGAHEYHINRITRGPLPGELTLTWSSRGSTAYAVYYTEDLVSWHLAADNVASDGHQTTSWIDRGSPFHLPPWTARRRFYRILENP
jgi:hypothetical protein